ncbi:hypothetical protein D3C84_1109960 [compost metagenome]
MAGAKLRGSALSSTSSAAGPPADDPMATRLLRDTAARCAAGAGRSRLLRSPISQPMLVILRSSGAAASAGLPTPKVGVSTTSSAPYPMASNTR